MCTSAICIESAYNHHTDLLQEQVVYELRHVARLSWQLDAGAPSFSCSSPHAVALFVHFRAYVGVYDRGLKVFIVSTGVTL